MAAIEDLHNLVAVEQFPFSDKQDQRPPGGELDAISEIIRTQTEGAPRGLTRD